MLTIEYWKLNLPTTNTGVELKRICTPVIRNRSHKRYICDPQGENTTASIGDIIGRCGNVAVLRKVRDRQLFSLEFDIVPMFDIFVTSDLI